MHPPQRECLLVLVAVPSEKSTSPPEVFRRPIGLDLQISEAGLGLAAVSVA